MEKQFLIQHLNFNNIFNKDVNNSELIRNRDYVRRMTQRYQQVKNGGRKSFPGLFQLDQDFHDGVSS